jgi:hypothetical protein
MFADKSRFSLSLSLSAVPKRLGCSRATPGFIDYDDDYDNDTGPRSALDLDNHVSPL